MRSQVVTGTTGVRVRRTTLSTEKCRFRCRMSGRGATTPSGLQEVAVLDGGPLDGGQRAVDTVTDQLRAVMDDGQLHRYSRTDEFNPSKTVSWPLSSDGPADTSGRSSHLPTNSPIVGTLAIIACSPGQLLAPHIAARRRLRLNPEQNGYRRALPAGRALAWCFFSGGGRI